MSHFHVSVTYLEEQEYDSLLMLVWNSSFARIKMATMAQRCWPFILMKGQDSSPERPEFRFRSAQLAPLNTLKGSPQAEGKTKSLS